MRRYGAAGADAGGTARPRGLRPERPGPPSVRAHLRPPRGPSAPAGRSAIRRRGGTRRLRSGESRPAAAPSPGPRGAGSPAADPPALGCAQCWGRRAGSGRKPHVSLPGLPAVGRAPEPWHTLGLAVSRVSPGTCCRLGGGSPGLAWGRSPSPPESGSSPPLGPRRPDPGFIWGRSRTSPDCLVLLGAPGAAGQGEGGPGRTRAGAPGSPGGGGCPEPPGAPAAVGVGPGPLRSAASCPAPLRSPLEPPPGGHRRRRLPQPPALSTARRVSGTRAGYPGCGLGNGQGAGRGGWAAAPARRGKGDSAPGYRADGSRGRDASPEPGACGCPSGLSHAERLTKVCVPRKSGTIEPPLRVTGHLLAD